MPLLRLSRMRLVTFVVDAGVLFVAHGGRLALLDLAVFCSETRLGPGPRQQGRQVQRCAEKCTKCMPRERHGGSEYLELHGAFSIGLHAPGAEPLSRSGLRIARLYRAELLLGRCGVSPRRWVPERTSSVTAGRRQGRGLYPNRVLGWKLKRGDSDVRSIRAQREQAADRGTLPRDTSAGGAA